MSVGDTASRWLPPSPHHHDAAGTPVLPTGLAELDRLLPYGGLPIGRLTEISGQRSSGKRTLVTDVCAELLRRQQRAVWIDSAGGFYPLPALEGDPTLQRLLVVQLPRHSPPQTVLRAADILLQATSAVALLVLDVADGNLGRPALKTGMLVRLQRGAESSGTAVVLITEKHVSQPSLGTLITLHLTVQRHGQHELHVTIAKSKLGQMQHRTEVDLDGPHGVSLDSTV